MFGLFKRKKTPKPLEAESTQNNFRSAPGTTIQYSPELVDSLLEDHKNILALYGDIKTAFEEKRYNDVSSMLNTFKSGLTAHLLTENVRLYIYLERSFESDTSSRELIHGFRHEMDGIAKVALSFLKKYETIGVDEDLSAHFGKDFETIGKVLVERIQKEEGVLYPLYMPAYS